ncbi:CHASE domain-containing protein [Zoogloea sp.]|uniref:CHASE domain-containing protein n=1 Tax=Zoogloea sp. TaxID=49181 RepID=UPI0014158FF2|nr:MAG: diguanylate cyclase [Zoogloea sp.]
MRTNANAPGSPPPQPADGRGAERGWIRTVLLPTLLVGVVAVLVGIQAISRLSEVGIQARRDAFTLKTSEITLRIDERFKTYRQVLTGARALFHASREVSRDEWRTYVDALRLPASYPGIQGIGFAAYIKPSQLRAHEENIRAEGFRDYRVSPPGPRTEYSAIVFIEPFDWRNQRAFGYDMLAEPVRRQAMMKSLELGLPALSGKVRLVQETASAPQAGVLLYLPLFRRGVSLQTPALREKALLGWIYSPFRMGDLITGTLDNSGMPVRLRIYDGHETTPEALLYDSHPERTAAGRLQDKTQLELDSRIWTLVFDSPPDLAGDAPDYLEQGAIALICGLFVLLTASFFAARNRARELARIGASLSASEARYSTLVNQSLEGIAALDAGLCFSFANPRLQDLLEEPGDALIGTSFTRFWPDDPPRVQHFTQRLQQGRAGTFEQTLVTRNGRRLTVIVTDAPRLDASGRLQEVILTLTDISERKAAEERIRFLASHDSLTGLANRASFMERMGDSLLMAQRHHTRLALLYLDLDHFKEVNDTLGHAAGDLLLVETARRMRQSLRASDLLARQGGDEFMALLHDIGTMNEALGVAEKIRRAINTAYLIDGRECRVSVSIGIALYPDHGLDLDSLARQADAAMYRAKSIGRNGASPAPVVARPEGPPPIKP